MPNLLIFKHEDMIKIENKKLPSRMINLNYSKEEDFSPKLIKYLQNDYDKNRNRIRNRYKCSIRKRWYDVPLIQNGNLMFFKRFNIYPKFVFNKADVHTTDIAYNIRLNKMFDGPSVAFCFYNSLTLALCEYNGRFYGGGVNELVPSEFKSLHIPYKKIKYCDIERLDKMLRNNENIEDVIKFVDSKVFEDISSDQLKYLKDIRQKYYNRRLR